MDDGHPPQQTNAKRVSKQMEHDKSSASSFCFLVFGFWFLVFLGFVGF
jgi:nitrate reductase NapE component